MSPGRSWARARAVHRHCRGLPLLPLAPHVFGAVEDEEWRPVAGHAEEAEGQTFHRIWAFHGQVDTNNFGAWA